MKTTEYDFICFLDCDAAFVNPNIKLEEFLTDSHEIYISSDYGAQCLIPEVINALNIILKYCKNNNNYLLPNLEDILYTEKIGGDNNIYTDIGNLIINPNKYNSGFFIMKKTELMNKLLNEIIHFYKYFAHLQHDQGCLTFLLQYPEYKNVIKKLPFNFTRKFFS